MQTLNNLQINKKGVMKHTSESPHIQLGEVFSHVEDTSKTLNSTKKKL